MKYLSYIKEFKHFPSEIFIFFTMFLFQTFLKTKKSEQTTIFIFNTFFSFFLVQKTCACHKLLLFQLPGHKFPPDGKQKLTPAKTDPTESSERVENSAKEAAVVEIEEPAT